MPTQDSPAKMRPLSRRTFVATAVAGFFSWSHPWQAPIRAAVLQQEDPWRLSGNVAERYQRYLVPAVFAPWATDLIARAALQPNDRVLDVACGTGVVARLVAQRVGPGGSVVGLDISPDMLAVARALPPVSGAAVHWREGNALSLPFSSHTFDKVLCQQGLQFFPDPAKALSEMRRVLVPDGRVAVSVWYGLNRNPYPAALATAIERHVGSSAADDIRAPFAFGDHETLRSLFRIAGFRGVTISDVEIDMHVTSVQEFVRGHLSLFASYAALVAKTSAQRQLVVDAVLQTLEPHMSGTELVVPWRAIVGTAAAGALTGAATNVAS